ncbi:MAG: hypothetical protein IRZ21_05885 [Thermoleophilaceae bacterium]|nr:hypothetical protein [Thermoleophilaceae bacterium]
MSTRTTLGLGAVVLALAAAGCGGGSAAGGGQASAPNAPETSPPGDIPDNQAYVRYAPPHAGYSLEVPEGWSRTRTGAAVSFTDKLNTVRLEERSAAAPPTVAGVKRTVLPQLARTEAGFKAGTVTTVRRKAGPAVRIAYLARGKPDPVTGTARVDAVERYLFFHNGREAIVTLSGPKGADNVDPWRIVTDSLRWTR